jgi:hypothetical protein
VGLSSRACGGCDLFVIAAVALGISKRTAAVSGEHEVQLGKCESAERQCESASEARREVVAQVVLIATHTIGRHKG